MHFRVGNGFDFHPLEAGRRLVLGGVEIQARERSARAFRCRRGGSCACQCDSWARWGRAISDGIFPITIRATRMPTRSFCLPRFWKLALARKWRLGNADLTIFAEQPKLKPYLDAMGARLAGALGAAQSLVNVKASSPEGIGALGRGDGMAAAAIVLLESD